jgi:hypothetical protein
MSEIDVVQGAWARQGFITPPRPSRSECNFLDYVAHLKGSFARLSALGNEF